MNNFIKYFISLIIGYSLPYLAFANEYSAINYIITPKLSTSDPYIEVETEIIGHITDRIIIDLPYKWGGSDYFSQIKNVRLKNANGTIKFKTKGVNQTIITIPKAHKISLSYELYQKPTNPSNVHETIIRKDLVHATGYGLLITPNDMNNKNKIKVNIIWKDIPDNWKFLSSHGVKRSLSFRTTVPELLHAIYVAGNIRIYQISNSKHPVYLSLYGNFDLQDKAIGADLSEIIQAQRSFF